MQKSGLPSSFGFQDSYSAWDSDEDDSDLEEWIKISKKIDSFESSDDEIQTQNIVRPATEDDSLKFEKEIVTCSNQRRNYMKPPISEVPKKTIEEFYCDECDQIFGNRNSIAEHLKIHRVMHARKELISKNLGKNLDLKRVSYGIIFRLCLSIETAKGEKIFRL